MDLGLCVAAAASLWLFLPSCVYNDGNFSTCVNFRPPPFRASCLHRSIHPLTRAPLLLSMKSKPAHLIKIRSANSSLAQLLGFLRRPTCWLPEAVKLFDVALLARADRSILLLLFPTPTAAAA